MTQVQPLERYWVKPNREIDEAFKKFVRTKGVEIPSSRGTERVYKPGRVIEAMNGPDPVVYAMIPRGDEPGEDAERKYIEAVTADNVRIQTIRAQIARFIEPKTEENIKKAMEL